MQDQKTPARLASKRSCVERYDISLSTIDRWLADGTLTAYRFGARSVRVDPDELLALMAVSNSGGTE